jgi:hypothetical protein
MCLGVTTLRDGPHRFKRLSLTPNHIDLFRTPQLLIFIISYFMPKNQTWIPYKTPSHFQFWLLRLVQHSLPSLGVVLSLYPRYFQLRYIHRLVHTYQTFLCGFAVVLHCVRFTL